MCDCDGERGYVCEGFCQLMSIEQEWIALGKGKGGGGGGGAETTAYPRR